MEDFEKKRFDVGHSVAMLSMRIVIGVSLLANYGWNMVADGWEYFWGDRETWDLIELGKHVELPEPLAFAVCVSLVIFLGGIAFLLGIFGRLPSIPLALVGGCGIYLLLQHSFGGSRGEFITTLHIELITLYLACFFVHLLLGPGSFSLDSLFAALRPPRRPRPASLADIS